MGDMSLTRHPKGVVMNPKMVFSVCGKREEKWRKVLNNTSIHMKGSMD